MTDHSAGWSRVTRQTTEGVYVTRSGEGVMSAGAPGESVNLLLEGDKAHGLGSFLEYRIGPDGAGPPAHWHTSHDELFYVVTGELTAIAGDDEHVLRARDFLFVPRGVVHTFKNPSDAECIFVSGWNPGGHERMFRRINEFTPEEASSPEAMSEILEMTATLPAHITEAD